MKSHNAAFWEKVSRTCERYHFYREDAKTLVGFSGGADSVTLLHFLTQMLGAEKIVAIHINHMLRAADSDRDEEFCRSFCGTIGVPLIVKKIDVGTLCGGVGIEETARNVRYSAFEEVAILQNCDTVSLAHTASDNLETMLFHLCRGAGIGGIAGIPPIRPLGEKQVVRPLIDCARDDILSYIRENDLSYVTDASNADTQYTRNFIRREIIPLLKKVGSSVEENARKTASIASDAASLIEEMTEAFLKKGGYTTEAPIEDICSLPESIRYPVLNALYQNAGGDVLSSIQAESVIALLAARKKGHTFSLSGGITAKIDGESIRFLSSDAEKDFSLSAPIKLNQEINSVSPHSMLYVEQKPSEEMLSRCHFSATVRIPASSRCSLYARARQNGEAYRFGGMTRSLKKLLCGTDSRAKARPLICDAQGILWLPGFGVAERPQDEDMLTLHYLEF